VILSEAEPPADRVGIIRDGLVVDGNAPHVKTSLSPTSRAGHA